MLSSGAGCTWCCHLDCFSIVFWFCHLNLIWVCYHLSLSDVIWSCCCLVLIYGLSAELVSLGVLI
jgi:hypothetical protein